MCEHFSGVTDEEDGEVLGHGDRLSLLGNNGNGTRACRKRGECVRVVPCALKADEQHARFKLGGVACNASEANLLGRK